MRARIHRGASEIGGNCVALEADGKRVVIDLGLPLDTAFDEVIELPDIGGLAGGDDDSLLGVVLSHPHQDHYGLVEQINRSVPVYIGQAAAAILDAAAFFTSSGISLNPTGFLEHRKSFDVGPFTITPYLVDHSAFDSYALLIEAGGRSLFYSGDFRAHGRKAPLFKELVERPPEDIDVLLLEGTHIRSEGTGGAGPDELDVELEMLKLFKSTRGLVTVFSSTQNIDRLVTVYRACKRAGRTLVVDLYGATVGTATGRDTIPQPGFSGYRIYVPNRQRVLVKESAEFGRVDAIEQYRIYPKEIREKASDIVMLIQGSTLKELAEADCLDGAAAVWSLWPGYLDRTSGERVAHLLDEHSVALHRLHASGHAHVEDLQTLADAIAPARIVPIHTEAPERFKELFPRVEQRADGEWWDV